jgi:hypothetical protein
MTAMSFEYIEVLTWTPTFAKLSFGDFKKVKIAAIHPDFM